MKKDVFIRLIKDFWERSLPSYVSRKKQFNFLDIRKIYVIVWPRRAGKTYFLYQIIDDLLQKWINKKNILYMYLEKSELYPLELKDLDILLEAFLELVSYNPNDTYFLFLDEIQIVPNWEKFAMKIYSDFPNIQLILTGSNNDLLSSEIASGLRWKATNFEILPLNFQEVLDFKNIVYDKLPSTASLVNYKQVLNKILVWWTFPEIVKIPEIDDKLRILEDYLEIMTFKDVIERFNLKSIKKIRYFEKLILSYMWDFVNLKKISQQVWADYNSILNWMEYFLQAYLWFEVKNFDFSVWKQQKSQSKIYILDNGYYSVNFYHYKEDLWKLFENWVFMEFKKLGLRENKNIFYFKNWSFDIDFVLVNKQKVQFIQVVYELNENNYVREVGQLLKLKKKYSDIVPVVIYKDNLVDDLSQDVTFVPFYNINEILYF